MRKSDRSSSDAPRTGERIFVEEGRWFIRTREGLRGPFASRGAAEAEAALFIDTVQYLERNQPSVPPYVDQEDITVVDMVRLPWR